MIKAAIFDLDGTLAYTAPDLLYSMNLMLKDLNYETVDMDRLMKGINYGSRHFVKMSLPENLRDDEKLIDKAFAVYTEHYAKHCTDKVCLYDGIQDLIIKLKSYGVKLAVLSNKDDTHTQAIINKIMPGIFDFVLGFSGKFPHKPDPAAALYIANEFYAQKDEVLYIGDSPVDMQTGKNAEFRTLGVSWGYVSADILAQNGPEAIVSTPRDILNFI